MQKWEYEVLVSRPVDPEDPDTEWLWEDDPELKADFKERLNTMGALGWELVNVQTAGAGILFLKRPVKTEEAARTMEIDQKRFKQWSDGKVPEKEFSKEEIQQFKHVQNMFAAK